MNTLFRSCLLALSLMGFFTPFVFAQQPPAGFSNVTVGSDWVQPVGLTFTPNGRLLVWEKAGKIWLVENNNKFLMLDISEEVGDWHDHGLLGLALDPQFESNGYVYLLYVVDRYYLKNFGTSGYDPYGSDHYRASIGRLTRYTARSADGMTTIDPTSRQILLGESISTGIPILSITHGVGSLVFGSDGTLLVSCGDGSAPSEVDKGSAEDSYFRQGLEDHIISGPQNVGAFRAQQVDALNGKVLRLDPATGDGVPSNPFFDPAHPRAPRSRVWALGLRNPFRMVKRPDTGSPDPAQGNPGVFYLGDVGSSLWEEMNVVDRPGLNFGWPLFEGFEPHSDYNAIRRPNPFFPNPLYQLNGCNEPFYSFSDLIKQATLNPAVSFTNYCNPAENIPASIPRFFHTRPVFDWRADPWSSDQAARTGSFVGDEASIDTIGHGSPVEGTAFGGNCSVAGVWYTGTSFPPNYQNGYFHADYAQGWIRFFHLDGRDRPLKVERFVDAGANVTAMAVDPTSGDLYYVHLESVPPYTEQVRKISYSANTVPVAVATADKTYGSGPLTVRLSGSTSTDPQGRPLAYQWNFGDQTPPSTQANPLHVFQAPAHTPVAYTITLKVTNDLGQFSTASLRVSLNNTPPSVAITSLASTSTYPLTVDTTVALAASVADAEQGPAGLSYAWQLSLHHNNHVHKGPIDAHPTTQATISPLGCNGEEYYYSITLTVTDELGLWASDEVIVLPNCLPASNVSHLRADPLNTRVGLSWTLPSQAVDEMLVVAKAGKSIGKMPVQGEPSYRGNASFSGNGTAFDGGKVVFRGGAVSGLTVTDLSAGEHYYFRVFSRVGRRWSAGVETSARVSLITGVEEASGDKGIDLFPNPAQETFWVRIDGYRQGLQAHFRLFNQRGELVLERSEAHVGSSAHWLSVAHLPSGLYLLQIGVGSEWTHKKVLLVR